MLSIESKVCGKFRVAMGFCSVLGGVLTLPAASAADDDYLRAIDSEADKVGAQAPAGQVSYALAPGVTKRMSREQFETALHDGYTGTFEFYRKLADRSREEIYEDYRRGASIRDVRKKIIDRLLQQ